MYINEKGLIYDRMGFYCFEEIFHQLGLIPPYWELYEYMKTYAAKERDDA